MGPLVPYESSLFRHVKQSWLTASATKTCSKDDNATTASSNTLKFK